MARADRRVFWKVEADEDLGGEPREVLESRVPSAKLGEAGGEWQQVPRNGVSCREGELGTGQPWTLATVVLLHPVQLSRAQEQSRGQDGVDAWAPGSGGCPSQGA